MNTNESKRHGPKVKEAESTYMGKKNIPKLVYICSRYSGDTEGNTAKAVRYSRFAVDEGYIPLTPHLMYPQFMNERTERELAMHMDLVILKHCKELWVFGENITSGMQEEIDLARKRNLTVKHFSEEKKLLKEEVWIRK